LVAIYLSLFFKPNIARFEASRVIEIDYMTAITTIAEPTKAEAEQNEKKSIVFSIAKNYFEEGEIKALDELIMRESTWSTNAQNTKSTAYGLFQFLDGTWDDVGCVKSSDIYNQTYCGMKYIQQRYGTPTEALRFHKANGHY